MNMKLTSSQTVEALLRELDLKFEPEYRFSHDRQWRFDYAVPSLRIAVEIEGGNAGRIVICNKCGNKVSKRLQSGKVILIREGGGHNSIDGFDSNCEKYNAAASLGWTVLRYTTKVIEREPARISRDLRYVKERGRI